MNKTYLKKSDWKKYKYGITNATKICHKLILSLKARKETEYW